MAPPPTGEYDPARGNGADLDRLPVGVEADHVDREAHADGVHRPAAREHQRVHRVERIAPEQAPRTLGVGLRDLERPPGYFDVPHRTTVAARDDAQSSTTMPRSTGPAPWPSARN